MSNSHINVTHIRVKIFINKKGGLLLTSSKNFKNSKSYIDIKCANGHVWNVRCSSILYNKSWCPYCKEYNNEKICRYIFENIFNCDFPKCRPEWLKSKNGFNLELDGYCKNLEIAFEYNGQQHYKFSKKWHKTKENFNYRLKKDKYKIEKCKKLGIKLIVIPFFIKYNDLFEFITDKLPFPIRKIKINIDNILIQTNKLLEIKNYVLKNYRGILLSTKFIHNRKKLIFLCKKNHIVNKSWWSIKRGYFCKRCSWDNKIKQNIPKLNCFLNEHNLELLGEYIGSKINMDLKCKICNNVFSSSKSHINRKLGCENHKIKIKKNPIIRVPMAIRLNLFLDKNNLELLSDYTGAKINMNWRCKICNNVFSSSKSHMSRKLGCEKHKN